jgi:SPP1 family predicted phage head-tail adaptor
MIAAGKLDRRVQLQAPTVSAGTLGGVAASWATAATVWAQVRALSGRETAIAQQVHSQSTLAVTVRYRADVRTDWRVILDDGRVARIVWIDVIGRKEGLTLICEAVDV